MWKIECFANWLPIAFGLPPLTQSAAAAFGGGGRNNNTTPAQRRDLTLYVNGGVKNYQTKKLTVFVLGPSFCSSQ